ncbi:MAG TPA: hypothetical protein IGS31_02485 [Oscillatoriales cyanobacterium M4454_W2019_049]|nr:hypothetical protein [Oscillatoriales cyanobacterium M4454_W2019_049]
MNDFDDPKPFTKTPLTDTASDLSLNNPPLQSTSTSAEAANNAQMLSRLSQEVANLRRETQDTKRLRGQVRWLTGLLIASVVILGGGLIGTTLSLRQEQAALRNSQEELAEQFETAQEAQGNTEQLAQLEEQLQVLNERTQEISDRARQLSEQLPNASLEQWNDLQERLDSLEQGIREGLSGEAVVGRFNQLSELLRRVLAEPDASNNSASSEMPQGEESTSGVLSEPDASNNSVPGEESTSESAPSN